ncbi:hypothetical protein [Lentibacillus sp. CBA3610]|uniref:hypothetical protein n=1 Tax=Lentibacillus sp. CBA3610 TaxID=2518176 RepID=UPI001595ACBC|nr:hypothetical protein [Lentibacillus sp. CBA3610]QKY68342.1 hypothetical protein Len3610_00745 [Lentibacillus sp. CBA3610]
MNENVIAKILFIIGVAQMAAGLIIGLITVTANFYMMNWQVFFAWTLGGFVSGMLFIGFAENIRLLHSINEKMRPAGKKRGPDLQQSQTMEDSQPGWVLGEDEMAKIHDRYSEETIVEIVPSPKEDYCLVRFKSGNEYYVRVVYIGGFGVQETNDATIRQSVIQWYNKNN